MFELIKHVLFVSSIDLFHTDMHSNKMKGHNIVFDKYFAGTRD